MVQQQQHRMTIQHQLPPFSHLTTRHLSLPQQSPSRRRRRWLPLAAVCFLLAAIWATWVEFSRLDSLSSYEVWKDFRQYIPFPPTKVPIPIPIPIPGSEIVVTTTSSSSSSPQPPPIDSSIDAFNFAATRYESIFQLCTNNTSPTNWTSSSSSPIIFTCNESFGGIGNVRNSILNCVRYTIAARASLVLPRIKLRSDEDIREIKGGETTELSYLFDTPHFIQTLKLSCPPLKLYLSEEEIPEVEKAQRLVLFPEQLAKTKIPRTGLPHPERWPAQFEAWFQQQKKKDSENGVPTIIDLGRSYIQYPIYTDGALFAHEFGKLLKFRPDIRRLATSTLRRMSATIEKDLQQQPLNFSQPILPNAYFGIHLRTEKDALPWGKVLKYGLYPIQSAHYLSQAPRSNTSLIYVASGDQGEIDKFARDAAKIVGMKVTTKLALLEGEEREELLRLKWDQQALVDFLVLQKGSDFAGIGHSSFAWNIALRRRVYAQRKERLRLKDWRHGDRVLEEGTVILSDEYSRIYGVKRPEYEACLWP